MAVKLYWWKGNRNGKNFGDELSRDVAAYVSGKEVAWAPIGKADLFSIGSIMQAARLGAESDPKRPVYVWGTGLMTPHGFAGGLRNMRLCALRGPLTQSAFRGKHIKLPLGDPGLLIDRTFSIKPQTKKYSLGIIPHHKQKQNEIYARLHESVPRSKIIDVGDHPREVAKEVSLCEAVISTSLHGLIVADSLKVPNVWGELGLLHKGGRFKFFDYFLSVKRATFEPSHIEEIVERPALLTETLESTDFAYQTRLEDQKDALEASFPPIDVVS